MTSEDMDRWRGRVALVTGASSGIGREVARRLARAGMRVAVCARRFERLEQLKHEEPNADWLPVACDMRQESDILEMFEHVRAHWGGVDVLVNNAGLGRHAPLTSGDTEAWREMVEVNVLALCVCTREAIQDMERRGADDGHIVHVSSMAAHRVPRGSGVYSATKYAVRSLTEGLRQELRAKGSHIRATAVSPGLVETEFHAGFHGDASRARQTYEQLHVLQPDDVAAQVERLLATPPHVEVHDVLMRPTEQTS